MTWDMKLGMLVGVGLVVAAALVFYRPDVSAEAPSSQAAVKAQVRIPGGYRTVQLSPMPAKLGK